MPSLGLSSTVHFVYDLGQIFNLSVSPFPHLQNGDNNSSHLAELL